MEEIRLVKEGQYWTLYIGELQCGCGYYEDMIEVIGTLDTIAKAEAYAKESQNVR